MTKKPRPLYVFSLLLLSCFGLNHNAVAKEAFSQNGFEENMTQCLRNWPYPHYPADNHTLLLSYPSLRKVNNKIEVSNIRTPKTYDRIWLNTALPISIASLKRPLKYEERMYTYAYARYDKAVEEWADLFFIPCLKKSAKKYQIKTWSVIVQTQFTSTQNNPEDVSVKLIPSIQEKINN